MCCKNFSLFWCNQCKSCQIPWVNALKLLWVQQSYSAWRNRDVSGSEVLLSGLSLHSRPIYSLILHNGYLLVNMYPACVITEIRGGVRSFPCQGTALQISHNMVSAVQFKKRQADAESFSLLLAQNFSPGTC